MFSAIAKWFRSGGSSVDKVTDMVRAAGDAVVFTGEEKSEMSLEFQKEAQKLWLRFMELSRDESSIKSVTRRILVFGIMGHWFLYLDVALVLACMGKTELAEMFFGIVVDLLWIVTPAATFYFGQPMLKARMNGGSLVPGALQEKMK